MGGVEHTLKPADYVLISPADTLAVQRIQLGPFTINLPVGYSDTIVCAIGLAANDAMTEIDNSILNGKKRVILGGTFLRKYITTYNYDTQSVDVSEADHGPTDKPIDVDKEFPALKSSYEQESTAQEAFYGSGETDTNEHDAMTSSDVETSDDDDDDGDEDGDDEDDGHHDNAGDAALANQYYREFSGEREFSSQGALNPF